MIKKISSKSSMSINIVLTTTLLALIFVISGCAYKGRDAILKTPYDSNKLESVLIANQSAEQGPYNLIRPEDELSIRNLQNKGLIVGVSKETALQSQLTTTYKVDRLGNIHLPIIGQVSVLNLSKGEAAIEIQKQYVLHELQDPIIDVEIVNMHVTVLGEVTKQGKYLLAREDMQLIDLLGEVGGLTPDANKKSVKIIRGDRSNPEIILVNLSKYDFVKNKNLQLRSGDIIYVEPKRGMNFHNLRGYAGFVQLGILALNCILIISNN